MTKVPNRYVVQIVRLNNFTSFINSYWGKGEGSYVEVRVINSILL